jgi:hypothetical protein
VCQLATAPFRQILAIFLKTAAEGFAYCGSSQVAKELKHWSIHVLIGFHAFSNETTKVSKIVSSINAPNKQGKIVNEHPSIPESQVATSVRERTFCSIYRKIKFDNYKGICRGMSVWFLRLYLETKEQFSDPRAHMAALGEQFEEGGGMDPTLLQSLFIDTGEILNLKVDIESNLVKHTFNQWRSDSKEMIRQLKTLPCGAYTIVLPVHQTAFIKINDCLGYFFDPNSGIIEIQGSQLAEKLYDRVSHSLKATGNGTGKDPYVTFRTITLRT